MTDSAPLNRRTLVQLGGVTAVGAGTLLLTACTAGDQSGGSETGSNSGGSGGGTTTVALSSIPVGGAVSATIGSAPVVVAQPTEGTVVAFSAVCTHQGCTVAPKGAEYDCPCHGSKFDAATGDVLNGPARDPLKKLTTSLSGDTVTVTA